jgi:bla regulator protein BlaR1
VCRLVALSAIVATLAAQTFDVASIHPHDPANPTFHVRLPTAGQFTATGAVPKLLVMLAYSVQDSQIVGAPAWSGSEKFDIDAKSETTQHTSDETLHMLQRLLADRFSLKLHHATQQRPVYSLTLAAGGQKFKVSGKPATNIRVNSNSVSLDRAGIAALAGVLSTSLGRSVVDHTGLTGLYDLSLQWDDAPIREGGLPGAGAPTPSGTEHGSIFTAIQNQLGLRLESQRAPVDVLVIDQIARPSAN